MPIQIAFIADPHLCIQARRRNLMSLLDRKLWANIDVFSQVDPDGPENHFAALRPSSYDDVPLLAAADFLGEFARQLDLLVVLGDLATSGLDEDLAVAEQVFLDDRTKEHLNAALEPRLGGLGIPLHVIPGNHDRYKDDYATPGCQKFDEVFKSVYRPKNGVCSEIISSDGVSLALISADFCFAEGAEISYVRRLGRGAVDDIVLSELDHKTRIFQREHPTMPVVWALHFSPAEGVSTALALEEREKVIHLAGTLGVNHIFCGHTHLRKREIGTHPHVYCAGSVSSVDSSDNHFLHVCTIDRNSSGELELEVFDLKYDETEDEFTAHPVSLVA
ncbi:metallophosphoesterase family protein [Sulfitobacter mediterraneus]|uniref:metallophosphoesterase family protein n=1 Tax=Sulfitobacter mediterraneus TaxID=83219 RepID=UPI0021A88737|nr:metallophosphoesterase [Sulfitobacter mediterraneus]UWR10629.1 metallophosphoesterase [Sulfitobacter mediterraneus]